MSAETSPPPTRAASTKKTSTVRHTRTIQRDRSKRPPTAPPAAEIERRLTDLIHPLTLGQVAHYHDLGLRQRVFFSSCSHQPGLYCVEPVHPTASGSMVGEQVNGQ